MRTPATLSALLPLLAAACVTPLNTPQGPVEPDPQAKPTAAAVQAEEDAEARLRAKERALSKAQRELRDAEAGAQLATLQSELDLAAAERKLVEAEQALLAAREELSSFNEIERAHETAKAELTVDLAKDRLRRAEEELAGLVEIYDEEEHALRAVKEVLRRNEVAVDFRKRELAQAERAARLVDKFTLPRKAEKLEWSVQKAEAARAAADRGLRRTKLAAEHARVKAGSAIEVANEALEDATRDLEKLRAKAEESGS